MIERLLTSPLLKPFCDYAFVPFHLSQLHRQRRPVPLRQSASKPKDARLLNVRIKDFFNEEGGIPPQPSFSSASAQKLANAITLLAEDDLEVLAAVAGVLESQRRRKRG